MIPLLAALTLAALAAPALILMLGRPAFGLLALVPAAGFGWVASLFIRGELSGGRALTHSVEWMPAAHLDIDLRLDALSGIFSLIILGMGTLVLVYCWGYFDSAPRRLALFGGEMTGFAMAMFGLVIADNFLLMYVFWELTSLLSFMLVSYYGERASSRRAAQQALMVTVLGGLAMLVGFISFGQLTGVWRFSDIPQLGDAASGAASAGVSAATDGFGGIGVAIVFVLAGALTKSAIVPAHFWLPGAMAAPTPVSAYLHSAAMVKAGIYLIARLAPDAHVIPTWHLVLIPLGVFTMLLGGWMALKQRDLKLVLAYGTVSQLGFITAIISIGSREAMQAGLALTVAHSLFKATLFMIVGAIDHAAGTRDIGKLSGLGKREPVLATLATVSALSMAGVPPLLGFVSKEAALTMVLGEELLHGMPGKMLLVGVVAGSALTMAYALRFLWGAFATKPNVDGDDVSEAVRDMHPIGVLLVLPPALLTLATGVLGVLPGALSVLIDTHLNSVWPGARGEKLALWHGFTVPLGISVLIIVAGVVLHWQRGVVAKAQFDTPALGSADAAYDTVIEALRWVSLRITASTQRGSLQYNLTTIFICLIALTLGALITGDLTAVRMKVADDAWQAGAAAIIIAAAVGATVLHNRLSAVLVVGVTGYGLAFIFATYGAPDLALTQLLVETMVVILFLLVLRKMPANVEWRQDPKMIRLRAWLSVAVGASVVIVGLFAINARQATPISVYMPRLAKEIGHGANTVNVLLVDIRAWDTFGEITVLVVAAIGVASLIWGTQSFARVSRRPTLRATGRRWLAADIETEKSQNRSLMVDVITRVLFPSMMTLSAYFFFVGHNSPGGGFAGGLVAALALSLRYLAGGRDELEEALPVDAGRVLGTGLLLSAAMVVAPMVFGYPPLTTAYARVDVPLVGGVSLPSALVFDAGVYLIVVGLTLHILSSAGAKLDAEEDARKQRARQRKEELTRRITERSNA